MADSKKVPAPKHRKAKSSSAEAFRKFLNKRVDIIEEDDSEPEDAKVVAPVVVKKDEKEKSPKTPLRCKTDTTTWCANWRLSSKTKKCFTRSKPN